MKKFVSMLTFGCQMNRADSERMIGEMQLDGYEFTDDLSQADLILVNTCCVRESAEEKIYGKLGELKKLKTNKPRLIIGVTGCMAQKEGSKIFEHARHVDFVLGTGKISKLRSIVQNLESNRKKLVDVDLNEFIDEKCRLSIARENNLSAWIPIMYGCDNFCTYCIVPYVRGREHSRKPAEILDEIKTAVESGIKEITLLGQNVNSYGKNLSEKYSFADLLTAVDKIPNLTRIRFMTSHPKDLNDDVINSISHGKNICEHIHLPIQHGSNRILKRMNRGYTAEKYLELVENIRREIPNVSLTTDLIVGFPGETEEDFEQTLELLEKVRFDAAYTFIYSVRSGTPAEKFSDQVPDELKHARLTKLMSVQSKISYEINSVMKDQTVEILVEGASKTDSNVWTGRTRSNKIVLFEHGQEKIGDFVRVKITQPQTWLLKGTLND